MPFRNKSALTAHSAALIELSRAGSLQLHVKGECMQPLMREGSLLTVQHQSPYWPGDIIVYARADGTLVSHRMLSYLPGRSGWRVLCRGDHVPTPDSPVNAARVIGRVTQVDGANLHISGGDRWLAAAAAIPAMWLWLRRRLASPRMGVASR